MTERPAVVICRDATTVPPEASVLRQCDCGREVWVGRSLSRAVAAGEMEPVCLACWLVDAGPDHKFLIHPDQERRLDEVGMLGAARQQAHLINTGKLDIVGYLARLHDET